MAFTAWFQNRERQIYAEELDTLYRREAEYAIAEIGLEVNALLSGGTLLVKEYAFHVAFDTRDYAEMNATPPNSLERAG